MTGTYSPYRPKSPCDGCGKVGYCNCVNPDDPRYAGMATVSF